MKKIMALILLFICLSSCSHRKMTRSEWLKTTSKTYKNAKKEEVFKAIQVFFELLDGEDFTIMHQEDSIIATREWLVYLVLAAERGTDTWRVDAKQVGQDVKVQVAISRMSGTVTGVVGNSAMPSQTVTTPSGGGNVNGTVSYDTFWRRIDFLMGLSDTWMDCKWVQKRINKKEVWGDDNPVCSSFNLSNNLPKNLKQSERDRITGRRHKNKR